MSERAIATTTQAEVDRLSDELAANHNKLTAAAVITEECPECGSDLAVGETCIECEPEPVAAATDKTTAAATVAFSTARHTPGPWHVHAIDEKSPCSCLQINAEHHPIGRVEAGKWGDHYLSIRQVGPSLDQKFEPYTELIEYGEIPQEVALANARLIAAAPTLYDAARCALADLEGIMPEFEPSGDREHPAWTTIEELRAALATATDGVSKG